MGSESPVTSGYQISLELATKVPILMPIPLRVGSRDSVAEILVYGKGLRIVLPGGFR